MCITVIFLGVQYLAPGHNYGGVRIELATFRLMDCHGNAQVKVPQNYT